jgi:hypothetical protein
MYPPVQAAQEVSSTYGASTLGGQVPPPLGIASRVGDLQKAVAEVQSLSYQVKAALGITVPETEAHKVAQASSLSELLTDLRMRITRSCADLQDALSHLNS